MRVLAALAALLLVAASIALDQPPATLREHGGRLERLPYGCMSSVATDTTYRACPDGTRSEQKRMGR